MGRKSAQKSKFKPKPGQVDFTNARWAPVINCVVRYRGRILLVRRSEARALYPGKWNGVAGFLDDRKSLREKVEEEIREEIGIPKAKIRQTRLGRIFDQEDAAYKKTWVVHPVLVDVTTDHIALDWEAMEYKWVLPREIRKFDLVPLFSKVIQNVLRHR